MLFNYHFLSFSSLTTFKACIHKAVYFIAGIKSHIKLMSSLCGFTHPQRHIKEASENSCAECKAGHDSPPQKKSADFMVNRGVWFLYDNQVEQIQLRASSELQLRWPESDPQPSSLTPAHQKGDDCVFPFAPTASRKVCLLIELPRLVKDYSLLFPLPPQVTG